MKAALLVCDFVNSALKEQHGDYPAMYGDLFAGISLDSYFVCEGQFPGIDDFDNYIITGSRHGAYDDLPWINDLKEFIRNIRLYDKKCIGICFGHQIIAQALGGEVRKAEAGYLIGIHSFEILQEIPWMSTQKLQYHILMLCQDQVMALPEETKVLSGNSLCPVGMYHIGKQFLGIQGHPEFTKEYNRDVFQSRKEIIGEEKIKKALDSFSVFPDKTWLRHLMIHFLNW